MSIFGENGFDANSVEVEKKTYGTLPKGEYDVSITNSTVKTTRAGDGEYLSVEFTLTGEYEGRKVWQNYNLRNKNEKTLEIAKQQLKSLCDAIGVTQLHSEDDLLGHDLRVYVIDKDERNEVRGYKESASTKPAEATSSDSGSVDAPW